MAPESAPFSRLQSGSALRFRGLDVGIAWILRLTGLLRHRFSAHFARKPNTRPAERPENGDPDGAAVVCALMLPCAKGNPAGSNEAIEDV